MSQTAHVVESIALSKVAPLAEEEMGLSLASLSAGQHHHRRRRSYSGYVLSADDVQQSVNDPFYSKLRSAFDLLFLNVWLLVLVAACARAIEHERECREMMTRPRFRCRSGDDAAAGNCSDSWWRDAIIYQIYPRSFQDSNADGVGDLQGVVDRLDYIERLGVGAVWLSPIYRSPMHDMGYDIADFCDIDPLFGTLADFDRLLAGLHRRGIRVVMDLVPNHTSDEHAWFQKSRRRQRPYTDYYVWHGGDANLMIPDPENSSSALIKSPPNNWRSLFGGSAWQFDSIRREYYLHQFLAEQPDLNFRNEAVREEIDRVLLFWLDRGVDGFRLDALAQLVEEEALLHNDEAPKERRLEGGAAEEHDDWRSEWDNWSREKTTHQPETFAILQRWRRLVDDYSRKHSTSHVMLIAEVYSESIPTLMQYVRTSDGIEGADMTFNFLLLYLKGGFGGFDLAEVGRQWMEHLPAGAWPNWVLGNHDNSRVANRLGPALVDAMNALLLLLPGTPTTYQGEELGMLVGNESIAFEQVRDRAALHDERVGDWRKWCRDYARTPMQWSGDDVNGGFSKSTDGGGTWLPLAKNFRELNVAEQERRADSHLNFYRRLAKLRSTDSAFRGNRNLRLLLVDHDMFSFERRNGPRIYIVVIDCRVARVDGDVDSGRQETPESGNDSPPSHDAVARTCDFSHFYPSIDATTAQVILQSGQNELSSADDDDALVALSSVRVQPSQVLVLRLSTTTRRD